jgi:ubiquinone/menaquinone biosynthesis C-methylase UbiE
MQIEWPNEQRASAAFSAQSVYFDEQYSRNPIIQYKRERVRNHLLNLLGPASRILELNSGTGEDAVFLAGRGHRIHATDISPGMLEKLKQKVRTAGFEHLVSEECCSYSALDKLKDKVPYDCIFSNFAGLNCTGDLRNVLASFDQLLKPGGIIVLVMLPKFCLWEFMLVFRLKFKTAFRRFFSRQGRKAKIDVQEFTCWYYNPNTIRHWMKDKYSILKTEGLCTIVPPSYLEGFPLKYPGLFKHLCKMEESVKYNWPYRSTGDYFILSLQKKGGISEKKPG